MLALHFFPVAFVITHSADIFAPLYRAFCLPLRCLLNLSVTTFSERGEERKKGGDMHVVRKERESRALDGG